EVARAHSQARHSAGLYGRVDLYERPRPSAGDGPRRARAQAVSLSPEVAQHARRRQVLAHDRFRLATTALAQAAEARPGALRSAEGQSARRARHSARGDVDPRGERGVRAPEPLLWIDDATRSSREIP